MKIMMHQESHRDMHIPVTTFSEYEQASHYSRARLYVETEGGRHYSTKITPILLQDFHDVCLTQRKCNIYRCISGMYVGKIFFTTAHVDWVTAGNDAIRLKERDTAALGENVIGARGAVLMKRHKLELIHGNVNLGLLSAPAVLKYTRSVDAQVRERAEYESALSSKTYVEYRVKLGLATSLQRLKDLKKPVYFALSDGSLISTKEIVHLVETKSVDAAYEALSK